MSATGELASAFRDVSPVDLWRSLEHRVRTPEFRRALTREFPEIAGRFEAGVDRRVALKLLGASLLMAGLGACKAPEGIAPYVMSPEAVVPGRPRFYATSLPLDGYGMGVLAESHEGRPTKIEGNVRHPASLGATDARMQAAVWSLYDPTRSRYVARGDEPSSWPDLQGAIAALPELAPSSSGKGLAVVIGPTTSPTTKRQLDLLRQGLPGLRIYRHAPLVESPDDRRPLVDLSQPDVIVSLGADFLGQGPDKLRNARALSDGRRVRQGQARMSRLYVFEPAPSLTGAMADWTRPVAPQDLPAIGALLGSGLDGPEAQGEYGTLIQDLRSAGGRAIVLGAERFGTAAIAARLNSRLGANVRYVGSAQLPGDGTLRDFVDDAERRAITAVVVLGVDIVHAAPNDIDVSGALTGLAFSCYLGRHRDATARACNWHVPQSHPLESWSDLRAFDGTASIVQPLIAPLYESRTEHDLLAALAGNYASNPANMVRETWADLDDAAWQEALRAGLVEGTAFAPSAAAAEAAVVPEGSLGISLLIEPDPYLGTGEEAGNLVLQELPRPLTKLTWGNAAEVSPALASQLGVVSGDEVSVARGGRTLLLPVFVVPGMADGVVKLAAGFGRLLEGETPVGRNAFALTGGDDGPVDIHPTGRHVGVITTQEHHGMEGRDLARQLPLAAFPTDYPEPDLPTLYPEWNNPDESWGMSIDLNSCIGCMACVSACQIENNSPVVGPEEMARGHDMHWLRVDRYYAGDPANPQTLFQPVPCMQCEDAPCEVVCPVNATVHTHDGLNAQVYNRCVGTRYCSQNCPYKVRRFNFFDYQEGITEDSPLSLLMNPDVTVRERGVMEKCTYCVQRIAEARIDGDVGRRPIADGTIQTACQQACPTRAITFGNIKDPQSAVSREKAEPHSYAMLEELGTRPRTTYLARIRNAPDEADV